LSYPVVAVVRDAGFFMCRTPRRSAGNLRVTGNGYYSRRALAGVGDNAETLGQGEQRLRD
jgi:hypothetical protein